MPVPSTVADLSTTAASNSPAATDSVTDAAGPDDYFRAHAAIIKTHNDATAIHGATGAVVGTTNGQTLTNKTLNLTSNTLVATSAQLATAVTDKTGTGSLVFATSPTLVTPALGTPASGDLRNCSMAVAPAIGGTTPAAGAFTTLSATGLITSNGQIAFPATQNASANANTLDDYEEGTWSPSMNSSYGAAATVTYTSSVAHYTKIGRQVTLAFRVVIASVSGGSGPIFISAIPFTQNTEIYVGNVWLSGVNVPDTIKSLHWGWTLLDNGSYYLTIGGIIDNTAMANANCIAHTDLATGDVVQGTLTYFI